MGCLLILGKGLTSLMVLFVLTKLMGRKQVGQLNLFDYIIGITIGSIAAEMILNNEIDFFEGTFAVAIYAVVAFFISLLTSKSIIARRIITGAPCILIEKGKILFKSLKKSKIDINDLLQEARNNGYFNISKIEYAIMEANGRISFLLKAKYQEVTKSEMKLNYAYEGLSANLIIDGKILTKNLSGIHKDIKWLMTRLNKLGYNNLNNILLVICDSEEKLTIYEKNINYDEVKILI